MKPVPAAAAAALLLLPAALARADVTADSGFGFEGSAVPGAVAPVRVDLSSSEKTPIRLRVEVSPARGMGGVSADGIVHSVEVYLAPGAKKRLTIPVLPRVNAGGDWTLTLTSERRTFLRHGTLYADGRTLTVPVGPGNAAAGAGSFQFVESAPPVLGVLGDPARRSAWLGDESRYAAAERDARSKGAVYSNQNGVPEIRPKGTPGAALPQTVFIPPEAAPDSWLCYEGLDAILWLDPDPDALKDAARVEALLEYASCGGRLVVALTPGARISAASPLALALPAEASGHDDVPGEEILAALGGTGKEAGRAPVPVARIGRFAGRATATLPDGRPLVVRRSRGLGTVVVVAFDPRLLSSAGAKEHALLLGALLGSAAAAPADAAEGHQFYGSSVEPLVNHLRKRFLSTPPLGLLVLGLALYVLAIGPVDYFLLKRKGKLRRTVVTFPLIVVTFTALAYGASFLLFGGSSGQARVAWLDFATAPGGNADVVRGLDVAGAYSPTGATLPVAYEQPRSFLGAPWIGSGFFWSGGDGGTLDGTISYGPDGRPAGAFDLPLRSHRTVQARFSGEIPLGLDAALKTAGGARILSIRNGLRLRIRDLCVVQEGGVHFPGDLEPGAALDVDLADRARVQWKTAFSDPRLPDAFGSNGGFFVQDQYGGRFGRGGNDQFVPAGPTEAEDGAARVLMARAAMGVSLAGLSAGGVRGQSRALGRQGLDLSRPVREGRTLVMGWCDGDPAGVLPPGRNMRSSVVVVRRVLPEEEGK